MNTNNTASVSPYSVGYTFPNSIALESNSGLTVETVGHSSHVLSRTLVCTLDGSSGVQVSQLVSSQTHLRQVTVNSSQGGSGSGSYQHPCRPQSSNLAKKHLVLGPQETSNSVCSHKQLQTNTFSLPKKQSRLGEMSGTGSNSLKIQSYQHLPDVHSTSGSTLVHQNILAQRPDSRIRGYVFPDSKAENLHGSTSPSSMVSDIRKQTAQTSTPYSGNCSDSSAQKSPTNSIEWQNKAYEQLQMLKGKYREQLKNLCYRAKEHCLQTSSPEERNKLENAIRAFERMYAFLSMPIALLANYPKEKFVHNAKYIIGSLNNPRVKRASATQNRRISQTSNHLNPSTQHQPGEGIKVTTSIQGSGSSHVGGHELQCQNTGPSYYETRPINSMQEYSITGLGASESSHANVIQQSLTSGLQFTEIQPPLAKADIQINTSSQGTGRRHVGRKLLQRPNIEPSYSGRPMNSLQNDPLRGMGSTESSHANVLRQSPTSGLQCTENKQPMENMNILPIFNAQSNVQQEAVSPLPQPSGIDRCSTQWQVDLSSRNTESASNSIMSANPIRILSPSIGKQKKQQMMKQLKVMPHKIITNTHDNPEKISARGTKRSNLEPAVDSLMILRKNHPVGQDRQSSPSSQGGLPNYSHHNVSSVSASLNHPQLMNPNGSSKQSQTSASLASVPSLSPSLFSTSCNGEYHVNSSSPEAQHAHTKNTDGTRDASHQIDDIHETEVVPCPVSVAKIQKTEVAKLLFQEIKTINRRLIETVVDVKDRMTNATHGGEGVILQFTYSAAGQKRSPNLMHDPLLMFPDLLLQVVISADYPNFSPCIVDRNPQPWSENGQAEALWNETRQKFDGALRKLVQPVSLIEMAKAWDVSAHEACREYADKRGGGCFSSKYGTWEKCIAT